MAILVRIPEALRPLADGRDEILAEGTTLGELLDDLEGRFSGIRNWLCDATGALRGYVNLFVNRREARAMGGLAASVAAGDIVSIVPAIRGGAKTARKIYLTFPQKLIKEPLIFRVGHEFNVVTNIRGASVSDSVGLVALEIEGERDEIERAIKWLVGKGVKVEPLEEEK